jgi:DNA-binding SARP family transcriptional activator/tetratricopeptide (TPR) repeat protein
MGVEIGLLGSVEVVAAGVRLPAGRPQAQTVLAALAVDVPVPVPVQTLIDRVWGGYPPAQARQAVWTRVAGIRKLLAEAASAEATGVGDGAAGSGGPVRPSDWLPWQSGGYTLRVDPDQVDLHRFRRLASAARGREYPDAERVELLAEALDLWRGVPLAGLTGDWVTRRRDSWQRERLEAAIAWAQAALRLGQHATVIPVLRDQAEQHPHSEPLAVTLARALAADHRTSEAVAECRAISDRLHHELGTTPGHELRALQYALLNDLPLPAPDAPSPPAAVPIVVPAQLPADVSGFAGRVEQLARLDALLATAGTAAPTAVVISAVSGTAGVGKTALAVHWAHRVAARFPDGQLHVNLRGFDPGRRGVEPAAAVRGFLDALGVPPERVPAGFEAQVGLYRSLLAGKRVLVLIDNARDAADARPLLPGTATALAVVTSRSPLTGLVAADGAHPLALDLLTEAESRELLESRLGSGRVAGEAEAARRIVEVCARLPLALALVAARAATHPSFRLAAVAAELADAAGRASVPDDAEDVIGQVRAVFSWSYTTLTPAAARLFRLLGLHPGPDTAAPAAASLAGLPLPQVRPLLGELARAGLLAEHVPGRYGFHDLLRAYATHLAESLDSRQERAAATVRLLDHYTHTAHTADRHLYPARDPIPVPLTAPAPGTTPEQPADQQAGLGWLDAEWPVLLAAQELAAGAGRDTHAWQLAWALDTVLHRRGRWHEWAGVWRAALPAAGRLPHPAAAYARRLRGDAVARLGDHEQAQAHLQQALRLYTEAADLVGQAQTHHDLGYLWGRWSRPDRALEHAQQALTLYRAAGHRRGQALALNNVGWCHVAVGERTQALTYCELALDLHQQLGDRYGEANAWDSLGYAHHHLDHHTQAADCYQHALTLRRDLGDRYEVATTLTRLGETYYAAGQPDQARTAWTTALDILADLDHPDADTVRVKLATVDQTPPTRPATTPPPA